MHRRGNHGCGMLLARRKIEIEQLCTTGTLLCWSCPVLYSGCSNGYTEICQKSWTSQTACKQCLAVWVIGIAHHFSHLAGIVCRQGNVLALNEAIEGHEVCLRLHTYPSCPCALVRIMTWPTDVFIGCRDSLFSVGRTSYWRSWQCWLTGTCLNKCELMCSVEKLFLCGIWAIHVTKETITVKCFLCKRTACDVRTTRK